MEMDKGPKVSQPEFFKFQDVIKKKKLRNHFS